MSKASCGSIDLWAERALAVPDDVTFQLKHRGATVSLRAPTARQAHAWVTETTRARQACLDAIDQGREKRNSECAGRNCVRSLTDGYYPVFDTYSRMRRSVQAGYPETEYAIIDCKITISAVFDDWNGRDRNSVSCTTDSICIDLVEILSCQTTRAMEPGIKGLVGRSVQERKCRVGNVA
jgi:hypothetical protein